MPRKQPNVFRGFWVLRRDFFLHFSRTKNVTAIELDSVFDQKLIYLKYLDTKVNIQKKQGQTQCNNDGNDKIKHKWNLKPKIGSENFDRDG